MTKTATSFVGPTPMQPTRISRRFWSRSRDKASIRFLTNSLSEIVTFFATFGSEEFPEFVGSSYVDGSGLFVNGVNVAGVLQTGGVPGDPLLPVNINHPDMRFNSGTELDGILAPNGNPVLRFDVPLLANADNWFTIILADASDAVLDATDYPSRLSAEGDDGSSDGGSGFEPILPSNPPDPETGAFAIGIPDGLPENSAIWIDPPISVGFSYSIVNALFASFTVPPPATIADLDGYLLTVRASTAPILAGQTINFQSTLGTSPGFFTLTGINPSLGLDPLDPLAFPSGVSFTTITGSVQVTMTPITEDVAPIPLPASLALSGTAPVLLAGLSRRRRKLAAQAGKGGKAG